MFEHCPVELQMTKMNLREGYFDGNVYQCEVIRYEKEQDCICLLLKNAKLPSISLDAKYQCKIFAEDETIICQGKIEERFIDRRGNMLIFLIENGFYKNNLN